MWAVGAILGELQALAAMFPGNQKDKSNQFEDDQLKRIYDLLGTPDLNHWRAAEQLPHWPAAAQWPHQTATLNRFFQNFNAAKPLFDLMLKCLDYNPDTRIHAADALAHDYFTTADGPPRRNIFGKTDVTSYPVRTAKKR